MDLRGCVRYLSALLGPPDPIRNPVTAADSDPMGARNGFTRLLMVLMLMAEAAMMA